ncbi:MAG: S8 family serine peptidase [Acidobacteriota bacterium]
MKKHLIILAVVFLISGLNATQALSDDHRESTYIVLLKAPSVVQKVLETTPGESRSVRRQILFGSTSDEYRQSLERSQLRTIQALTALKPLPGPAGSQMSTAPRIAVLDRRSFLVNMLVVRCSPETLVELRKHPDVKAVYPNRSRRLHLDSVPTIVSANAVWEMLGGVNSAGQGVRIAIIDSGIDQAHPMFQDPQLTAPPGFPRPAEFAAYTTNKVIVARDYVRKSFDYADQAVHTPQDEMGHGTEVASIAAGVPVPTPYVAIQGMAAAAYLGNYKVFGQPGVNEEAKTAAIVAAINDAVADQMDVINLSLGGIAQSPETDPEQQAIAEATEAGVLVVVSAGNGGPNPGTVSSPGTSPEALTVGATQHGRYFAAGMDVTSPDTSIPPPLALIGYVPALGQTVPSKIGPVPLASILPYDPSGEGCSPFPAGSLTAKMALIRRGTCKFAVKAGNAIQAGAVGAVIYQNVEGPPINMAEVNAAHLAVMIEKGHGEALHALLPGHSVSVTLRPQSEILTFLSRNDQIASFSSRGPDIIFQIKPDIVAPGQDILAAAMNNGFARGLNGTSFSAPVVSGAGALMFQLHPNWSARDVKSSLVNSAERELKSNGGVARVIDSGNGRLNIAKGAGIAALLDPVSLSFGIIGQAPAQDIEKVVKVTNPSSTISQTISAELVETSPHPSVQLTVTPIALSLGPGQSSEITVTAKIISPLQYGTFEGYLQLSSSVSSIPITASYWGAIPVEDPSMLLKVAQDGSATYDSISDAVVAARPGATIEIQDSATYSGSLTIGANTDGLPLHGLTLRPRNGQSPTLQPDSGDPGVLLSGVQRVTLDGLTVLGGLYGVLGLESTGAVANSMIDGSKLGLAFENSQFSVRNTTVKRATGTGLLAYESRMNLANTNIQESAGEGLYLYESPALVQAATLAQNKKQGVIGIGQSLSLFDSTIEKNEDTGVILVDMPTLLKRNLIRETTGPEPDGIAAVGNMTLWAQENQISNNGRHGLLAELGPEVHSLRNQITGNRSQGLFLSNASGSVESSWLTGNGRGIRIESSGLQVSNSVISGSSGLTDGDGIYADQGQLTVLNTTIVKNSKRGLKIVGSTHLIANSILSQNTGGDIEGGQQNAVHNNIIGDGVFSGTNGNQQADPRFTDAIGGDFSLRLGSPAIDAASSEFPSGSFDALSLERVVAGTAGGQPRADIGALEYNSKNWLPLILPVLSSGIDEFVGLAMVNSSSETAHVELSGFNITGSTAGASYKKDIPAGSQFSILLSEALPNLKQGWVRITSNKPDFMSFSLLGNNGLTKMDGAQLSNAISPRLLFPEIRGQASSDTQIYVVNPNADQVSVVLTFHTPGRNYTLTYTVNAHGALVRSFSKTFGSYSGSGYLTVEAKAEKPLFAMEIFSNGKSLAGLLGLDMTRPQAKLYGAQLAVTSAVDTILNVINLGTTAADLTLEAFDEAGTLIKSVVVNKLGGGQQYRKTASEIFGLDKDLVGWARVSTTEAQLAGCLVFSDTTGNFMASLPLQAVGVREFVLGHVAQTDEVFTGVTLLNAGTDYAQVSLEVFGVVDGKGVSNGMALFELKPYEKRARLLAEYLPGLANQDKGFVRVRSSAPIFGFELFGHNQLRFMSAVPQQVVVY